jgi:lysophospholipase L1-like esterase
MIVMISALSFHSILSERGVASDITTFVSGKSSNDNIGNSGYTKPKMLESDGYHLSFDGVVVLAANIKHSIDNAHGAQSSGD